MTQSSRVDLSDWAFGFSSHSCALQVGLSTSLLTVVLSRLGFRLLFSQLCSPGWAFGFSSHSWMCVPARRSNAKVRNSLYIHQIKVTLTYLLG